MTWVAMSLFGLALVTLAGVGLLYGERHRQFRLDEKADHAKCVAHLTATSSNHFVAARVRDLADRWDSIEEQGNLRRLANERYTPGGPSMPVIWLRYQADQLEGGTSTDDMIYNMAGERVL